MVIKEGWEKIKSSMRRRLEALIDAQSGHTNYIYNK